MKLLLNGTPIKISISARTRACLRGAFDFSHIIYHNSSRKLVRTFIISTTNILTIVKDRLAGGGSVSAKAAPPAVEHVSVASARTDQLDVKSEPVVVEEPITGKPPSEDLQAFDPIRTFFFLFLLQL